MRSTISALAAAALAFVSPGGAQAFTMVVGGLAGQCSILAHSGHNDGEARDVCTHAILAEPLDGHDLAGTYVNRGAMELGAMLNQDAHADFRQAIGIMPKLGEAHVGEGAYLVSQAKFAEAEAEIDRGLACGSEEPEKAYYIRAIARWGQDNFKGAYDDFQHAIALKPGWSLPREQLKNFHVAAAP